MLLVIAVSLSSFNYPTSTYAVQGETYITITISEAKDLIENTTNLFILDVRTEYEYEGGHISGAYLIPYTEIINRQDELPANKSQPILVYCRSGRRSAIASSDIVSLSYNTTYNMGGGFSAWKSAGYPYVNSGTTNLSIFFGLYGLVLITIYFRKQK